jgi:hypothetical protein
MGKELRFARAAERLNFKQLPLLRATKGIEELINVLKITIAVFLIIAIWVAWQLALTYA